MSIPKTRKKKLKLTQTQRLMVIVFSFIAIGWILYGILGILLNLHSGFLLFLAISITCLAPLFAWLYLPQKPQRGSRMTDDE